MEKIKKPEIIIITGLSGAGKSVAIKSIEDFGGFCVDNMPAALIVKFIKLIKSTDYSQTLVAFGVDVRSRGFMDNIFDVLSKTEKLGYKNRIIFLEAPESVILRRYSESRHRHPMSEQKESLKKAVEKEKAKLAPLREKADIIIDTGSMTPHELKMKIKDLLFAKGKKSLNINIVAFGFKYGIPENADVLMDTRFLPNPHYENELSMKTGNDSEVIEYVMNNPVTKDFLIKFRDMLDFLVPNYLAEGKSYLNIGIGCTGGRHRSVVIANEIRDFLNKKGHSVFITYRDIDRK